MEFRAVKKHIRMSPRRARLVADHVRGDFAGIALDKLALMQQKAAKLIYKTIESAVANAENYEPEDKGEKPDVDNLYVSRIFVDEGPTMKRLSYRAYGRANRKRRRTCHITVVLDIADAEMVASGDSGDRSLSLRRPKGETATKGKKKGVKNWLKDKGRQKGRSGSISEGSRGSSASRKTIPSE